MAEILLIFPPDKRTAAHQIEAALASAGYRAVLEPAVEPDGEAIARKASDCSAALLIWSRPLAASADLGGWLAALRRLPNLIEVSTDGIAPQSGDERRVVLLSGWRGQPFHLGWQRILEELESLGARRTAGTRPEPRPAAAPAAASAAAGASPAASSPGRGRRLALPAAAALAIFGLVAGAAWIGTKAPGPPPQPAAARSAAPPPSAGIAMTSPPRAPEAAAGLAPAEPQPPPVQASASVPPNPDSDRRAELPSAARAASARAPRPPTKTRPVAAPPLKRYSRKNSKTMRLFCARSGRSTPQCRIFARSTGADRP